MQMYDANDDGRIDDTDTGDGTTGTSDRFVTPDGVSRQVNETVVYNNTVLTYTLPGGGTATWTVTMPVWQLGNGDLILRITESTLAGAPADFNVLNVTNITLGTWDGTNYSAGLVSNFDAPPPICFTSGTLIETDSGPVAVEALKVGDLVLTQDCGMQPIRWIGSRRVTEAELISNPDWRPIRIRAGVLGPNRPEADLVVSPQHRILTRSKVAERMFGDAEVLIAAKHLQELDGIEIADDMTEVTYWHLLFEAHQVVFSNGAATESLFTGSEALKAVSPEARAEILAIFPGLAAEPEAGTAPVRLLVPGQSARSFVRRVARNSRSLVA